VRRPYSTGYLETVSLPGASPQATLFDPLGVMSGSRGSPPTGSSCRVGTPCSMGKALRLSGAETLQHRDVTETMIYFCRVGTPCSTGKALRLSGAETRQHGDVGFLRCAS